MLKLSAKSIVLTLALILPFAACNIDKSQFIPTVQFSASTTYTITGTTVTFTNQSSGATSYLWKFGDGTVSTEANPSHRFDSIGSFRVILTGYNTNGTNSDSVTIEVRNGHVTILDALGIQGTYLGTSWFDVQYKYSNNALYKTTYDAVHNIYLNQVYYKTNGIYFIFVSAGSTLKISDYVGEIIVVNPFAGNSLYGISIGSPRGNVLYYYGKPSSTSVNADNSEAYWDYVYNGISFYILNETYRVEAMEIYSVGKKKSGNIFPIHPSLLIGE
jgi:PKD repeat protein